MLDGVAPGQGLQLLTGYAYFCTTSPNPSIEGLGPRVFLKLLSILPCLLVAVGLSLILYVEFAVLQLHCVPCFSRGALRQARLLSLLFMVLRLPNTPPSPQP